MLAVLIVLAIAEANAEVPTVEYFYKVDSRIFPRGDGMLKYAEEDEDAGQITYSIPVITVYENNNHEIICRYSYNEESAYLSSSMLKDEEAVFNTFLKYVTLAAMDAGTDDDENVIIMWFYSDKAPTSMVTTFEEIAIFCAD